MDWDAEKKNLSRQRSEKLNVGVFSESPHDPVAGVKCTSQGRWHFVLAALPWRTMLVCVSNPLSAEPCEIVTAV
jgi:hypothetical protein